MSAPSRIVMMPNGFVGSWMLKQDGGPVLLTGMTEAETERIGRQTARRQGVAFVRFQRSEDIR